MFADSKLEVDIKEYINTLLRFSVPIFLFLSGVFFRRDANFEYLKNKIQKIFIPYTIISIPATIFLVWKYSWNITDLAEIILSYLFGYKFGFFFIFIIICLYAIGFLLSKINITKNINKILIASFAVQFIWLAIDEFVYNKFNLYEIKFFQFQLNELIFYRIPFTWISFFTLGLWYQEERSRAFIQKNKTVINALFVLSFLFCNFQIFYNFGDYTPYGSIIWSIFSVLFILFLLNLNFEQFKKSKIIEYLSRESFAIFLIHYFFLYLIIEVERLNNVNFPYSTTLIFFPAIFLATIAVIHAVKKIAGKRSLWIIGG